VIETLLLGALSSSTLVASSDPHRRNIVFAGAATVFVLIAGGWLLVEAVTWFSKAVDRERRTAGQPQKGYFGLVSSTMDGSALSRLRKTLLSVELICGVVAVVAFVI
jgi:hypothetical protein